MNFLNKIKAARPDPVFVKDLKDLIKWADNTFAAIESRQQKVDGGYEDEALRDNKKHLEKAIELLYDVEFEFSKIHEDFLGN